MALDPEQKLLLADLVEADRRIDRLQRDGFFGVRPMDGKGGVQIIGHSGWTDSERRIPENDMHELVESGALRYEVRGNHKKYWVTSAGFAIYEQHKRESGEPVSRIEQVVRVHLDTATFRQRYPEAYAKWSEAEARLWAHDSEQNLTVIGHLCREAMQEFAASLVAVAGVVNVPNEPNKTVDRLRAVIAARSAQRRKTDSAFGDALIAYWGTTNDLAQRQEHGSQREARPLTWNDAKRLVLHLIVVMFEIDGALG